MESVSRTDHDQWTNTQCSELRTGKITTFLLVVLQNKYSPSSSAHNLGLKMELFDIYGLLWTFMDFYGLGTTQHLPELYELGPVF